ncbi:MAG TPA: bifunctional nuclease family protein [Oceanithermus sp.]|nr:bifunctional nuclease family protein [Oceanithermus sp.]
MLKAKVENLGVDPNSGGVVVLLRAENDKLLPIWIGALEGQNIAIALAGEKPPRPLTPDLLLSVLDMLGGKLVRVEITELKDNTFYARLVIEHKGIEYEIDARPSDAIALALRADAPIYVDEKLVEEAAVEEAKIEPQGGVAEA